LTNAVSWHKHRAAVAIASALAAAVMFLLRDMLAPGFDRLPGTDSGNLYSWELYTRSVLATGRLPHWNPYQFGGTPHLADTQTTVLYPLALLLRWLNPLAFLPWMAALHLWLAGIGMLVLGRVVGVEWLAASAAAVAVTFGGTVTPWLHDGYLLLIYSAAWLPWALAFAILSVRRGTVLPHPGLVCVLVLQLLAGYLQGFVYATGAVCLYFLYSALWPDHTSSRPRRWLPIVQLSIAGVIAAGVSAFQLLPTATLVAEAGRTFGIPYETAVRGSWSTAELATFFFPSREAPSAYVGWLLACVIPFALFDRPRVRFVVFFAILAAISIAVALGDTLPLYRWHYAILPGFRTPVRTLFVATVSAAALGAMGLQHAVAVASRREWRLLVAPGIIAVAAASAAIVVAISSNSPQTPVSGRWPWVALTAVAGLAFVLAVASRRGPRFALAVAVGVVALDLTTLPAGALESIPVTPIETVRRWLGDPDVGRVISLCENVVGPRELLDGRHASFNGFGGVFLRNYAELATLFPDSGPLRARRDLVDLSGVSRVVACRELDAPGLTLMSHTDSIFVYRNENTWPPAVWTCGALLLTRRQVIEQLRDVRYDSNRRLVPQHFVTVRWAAGLPEDRRRDLERRYGLAQGVSREGTAWRYRLHDRSSANIAALLRDPVVDDTHGLDRSTGALVQSSDDPDPRGAEPEMLIGAAPCTESGEATVLVSHQPDGRVAVGSDAPVAGMIFFSEPYYSERQAFVDGQRVTPIRANVAFMAVPVPPGKHHVELRYVPSSFHRGAGISAATLTAWTAAVVIGWRHSRRRRVSY
jgi:hypothetical protein